MPFKTLEQVWVESCDSPPNNTLSSVYFNVPKTSRHQAWLSGSTYCYSAGILPISPPVPKSFLLDGSSRKAVVRSSSNLLMGQNDVPVIGKAQFQKDVYVACWRSCIFSQLLFLILFFSLPFMFIYLRHQQDHLNHITFETKCLTYLHWSLFKQKEWIWFH